MKKTLIYIFFDDVIREYCQYYGKEYETVMVENLTKYLRNFSKTSQIIIITNQNISQITDWFLQKKLFQFVEKILNPVI